MMVLQFEKKYKFFITKKIFSANLSVLDFLQGQKTSTFFPGCLFQLKIATASSFVVVVAAVVVVDVVVVDVVVVDVVFAVVVDVVVVVADVVS